MAESKSSGWIVADVIGVALLWANADRDDSGHDPYGPLGGQPVVDLECADVGRQVYVGADDPNGLDSDHDGIGCEGW